MKLWTHHKALLGSCFTILHLKMKNVLFQFWMIQFLVMLSHQSFTSLEAFQFWNLKLCSSLFFNYFSTNFPTQKKCHFGWRDFFWDENFGPPSSRQRNCRRTSFEEVEWRTGASAHRVCHLQSCPWFWQMRPPGRSSESTQKMKFFNFRKIGFFCIGIPEDYFCW